MSTRFLSTCLVILLTLSNPTFSIFQSAYLHKPANPIPILEFPSSVVHPVTLPSFANLVQPGIITPQDHIDEIIVVNTHLDTPDLMLSDDQCEDQTGYCSLRAAVQSSNLWPGAQTILLETGVYTLTRAGVRENAALTGDLDITGVLTITANYPDNPAINANWIDRVLDIQPGAMVVLQNIGVAHGMTPSSVTNEDFTQRYGGGIYNAGDLTLQNVGIGDNTTGVITYDSTSPALGGGIYSKGPLRIYASTISYNTTSNGYSGATYAGDGGDGAGVYAASAQTLIDNSVITHNQTGAGGDGSTAVNSYGGGGGNGAGIFASEVISLTIRDSLVDFNLTGMGGDGHGAGVHGGPGGSGAGIYAAGTGETLIIDSIIADNITGVGGSGCLDVSGENNFCSGGVGAGLGVSSQASLALRNSQILRNTDGVSGGISASGADGGGVYCAESNLSMENATIQDNHAGAASDGVTYGKNGGYGGGLFAYACNMTISQSDILDNLAGQGSNGTGAGSGGLGGGNFSDTGGTLSITDSNISGNSGGAGPSSGKGTGGFGGGIYSRHSLTISGSTLANNHAGSAGATGVGGDGGGVYAGGTITISNSTLSGNSSGSGGAFGGKYGGYYISGTLNLESVTATLNSATSFGAGYAITLNARNSLIANNSAVSANPDCLAITSQGYNLVKDLSGCTIYGDQTGIITGLDPALGPLALNEAGTYTHALTALSPALDAANPLIPGSGSYACPANDQRAFPRTDFRCDIGAYESQHQELTTITRSLVPQVPQSFGPLLASITLQSETPITVTVESTVTLQQSAAYVDDALPTYWLITQEAQPAQSEKIKAAAPLDERLLDMTFCYTDQELGAYAEDLLRLIFWDGFVWVEQVAEHDAEANCFSQSGVTTLGLWNIYQPAGAIQKVYLPAIQR